MVTKDWANTPAMRRWTEMRKDSGESLRNAVANQLKPLREALTNAHPFEAALTDLAKLDAACAEVARTISTRQSATETTEQFVRRLARAVMLEMLK